MWTKERLSASVHTGPMAPPSPLPPQANGEIGNDHHEDNPEPHLSQMLHYVHGHSISPQPPADEPQAMIPPGSSAMRHALFSEVGAARRHSPRWCPGE